VLATTTHEGALKATDLVLLPLRSWRDHIRANRQRVSSRAPAPLILLCLSDRPATVVWLLDIAHITSQVVITSSKTMYVTHL
jgi:hypothetical protein